MAPGRLTTLQERILAALSGLEPAWTLAGRAALAGFHTQHRTTRDIDIFWRGRGRLDDLADQVEARLSEARLDAVTIQAMPSFHRFEVRSSGESCVLDLVAEDVPPLTTAETFQVGGLPIAVDAPHEILVDKLCALLGRAELRDLVDVRELLAHAGDLTRALADAPRKDRGFSAVTLAWVLSGLDLRAMARMEELAAEETRRLEASRDELVDRLTRSSMP